MKPVTVCLYIYVPLCCLFNSYFGSLHHVERGGAVGWVTALLRGFDSLWCHWNFSL